MHLSIMVYRGGQPWQQPIGLVSGMDFIPQQIILWVWKNIECEVPVTHLCFEKKGSLCETLVVLVVTGIFIFHHHSFYPIS